LPGLNGFVGEFTILVGAFKANPAFAWPATAGIILAAWYMLTAFRQIMQGPVPKTITAVPDLTRREIAIMVPLVVLFVVIGLFPNLFFDKIAPSVESLAQHLRTSPPAVMTDLGRPGF
jgi:NADH-quinone oxidoreductase subunit M